MIKQSWRDRLIDPRSPDRRPRRAAYALPTLFTAGNVFLGFYALMESFLGSMAMVSAPAPAPKGDPPRAAKAPPPGSMENAATLPAA